MARVFAANTRWAEAACHLSCKHRTLAGWLAAVATPGLPVPISRAAALHTWPAYRDAIVDVVSATDWPTLTSELERDDVAVDLIWGEHDQLCDRDVAAALPGVSIGIIAGADHHLQLTHPGLCVERLASTP